MCTSVGLAAIIATEDQGMMQVQLELDSMSLVNTLKSNEYDHSPELGGILFGEIKVLNSFYQHNLLNLTCRTCLDDCLS